MDTQRQRVYSFSSNETILEAYSSSPPSSAGLADISTVPTWQLSARELMMPVCQSLSSGRGRHHKRQSDGDGVMKVGLEEEKQQHRQNPQPQAQPQHQNSKMAAGHADAGEDVNESEEKEDSINWDESAEEEDSIDWDECTEEEDVEERRERRRLLCSPKAQASLPQTVGFWFDWWIGEVAFASLNIDFQALCASMQLWREKNEVDQVLTYEVQRPHHRELGPVPPPAEYLLDALVNPDGSFASESYRDSFLQEVKWKARDMHQTRKWRTEGRRHAAGWCKWGAKRLSEDRGGFVEEDVVGYEVQRKVDGQEWAIQLGYRRDDTVLDDMDLDEADGGENPPAGDSAAVSSGPAKEDGQDRLTDRTAGDNVVVAS